jgi:hypothetical protein
LGNLIKGDQGLLGRPILKMDLREVDFENMKCILVANAINLN